MRARELPFFFLLYFAIVEGQLENANKQDELLLYTIQRTIGNLRLNHSQMKLVRRTSKKPRYLPTEQAVTVDKKTRPETKENLKRPQRFEELRYDSEVYPVALNVCTHHLQSV